MVVRRISSRDARANFSDVLGVVYYAKEAVIVEKKGKPVAVLINPEEYERLQQAGQDNWAVIERVQANNAAYDPDEVLADVTAEVEVVRQELHEERKRAAESRR